MRSLLTLDRVCKSHWRGPHEIPVLSEVSLAVDPGELVAVWGGRGSGKTTLARLAVGLEEPDSGTVRFRGQEISRAKDFARLLHDQIGWVRRAGAQASELPTVADYLALPLLGKHSPRGARRLAAAALERLGVGDCANASWSALTDGQRTLVSLAHALVRDPVLLVADDPTASLNVLQREEVMLLLRRACDEDGLGVLITVPDMPEMAHADTAAMLGDGRLILPEPGKQRGGNVVKFPAKDQSA
jgi:putative ABC transport system ATP-binding protein